MTSGIRAKELFIKQDQVLVVANYYYSSNLKTGGTLLMVVGTKDLLDHLKERIDHIE